MLVIGFFICFAQNTKALDTLNPCWRLLYPHDPDHESFNPDSVMIDTCATTNILEPVLYAYKWYIVTLPAGALNVPWAPRDSVILRNWRDIDTNFIELRNDFKEIEELFSPFIMKKRYPDLIDTSTKASRSFFLNFEKYCNIDTLLFYLTNIQNLFFVGYDMRTAKFDDVKGTYSKSEQITLNIYPNPSKGTIVLSFDTFEPGIYSIRIYNSLSQELIELVSENFDIEINKKRIDVSDLTPGMYFLRLTNGRVTKSAKFVVE